MWRSQVRALASPPFFKNKSRARERLGFFVLNPTVKSNFGVRFWREIIDSINTIMKHKKPKLTIKNMGVHVQEWKLEIEVLRIKRELIEAIQAHCKKHEFTQRELAAMVPGLTQDRVSKIFSGKHGHMTIDKLVEVTTTLDLEISLSITPKHDSRKTKLKHL